MRATRPLGPDDLDLVCRHRLAMHLSSGRDPAVIDKVMVSFPHWMAERLADGRCFGFVTEVDGVPVGSICQTTLDWPPHPNHPDETRRGYILTVFVEDSQRDTGLGRQLMQMAQDEFRRRGISFAMLHATKMGRPLYEDMGWVATNEMSLRLPQAEEELR